MVTIQSNPGAITGHCERGLKLQRARMMEVTRESANALSRVSQVARVAFWTHQQNPLASCVDVPSHHMIVTRVSIHVTDSMSAS
jgi:hypothetical protein